MGFFKNVGKTIKKATKQISLKNVIKLGSSLDPTGIARGVVDSVQAKKDEKKALAEQQKAEQDYQKAVEQNNQFEALKQKQLMEIAKQEAQVQRVIVATNNQAVGGKIGVVAGSIAGDISRQAIQTASQQIDQNLQLGVAQAGANLATLTFNEWLKINWWKVLAGIIGVVVLLKMFMSDNKRR